MQTTQDLLSTSEVARRLGLSDTRVVQLANAGLLRPALVTSLGRLFDAGTVVRYRRQRQRTRRTQKPHEDESRAVGYRQGV
jgi:DNA-binding transcriptional MerR regulator